MAEINIRYLQDADGDRYFPMTHANAILGLEEFDNGDDISNLNALINKLTTDISAINSGMADISILVSNQKTEIDSMKTQISNANTEIENLKQRIEELEDEGAN